MFPRGNIQPVSTRRTIFGAFAFSLMESSKVDSISSANSRWDSHGDGRASKALTRGFESLPICHNHKDAHMLIGIAGPAGSGKDTLCQLLIEQLEAQGSNAKRYAFADPIKTAVKAAFNLTEDHVNGEFKEKPIEHLDFKSPRQVMQWFGTDFARRMIHNDIWINVARSYIDQYTSIYDHVIISDVRFENEAAFIRDRGGIIAHIKRDNAPSVNTHDSEQGIESLIGDYIIFNNGTLQQLTAYSKELICSIS